MQAASTASRSSSSTSPKVSSSSNGARPARGLVRKRDLALLQRGLGRFTQAERISKACGEYGIVTRSKADGSGISRRQPLQIGTRSRNESETRAESRRRLITADEILHDMRTDDQIVFLRGLKPLRCGRAIYFRRPDMASAVGANPFSPATPAPRVANAPAKGRR